MILSLIVNHNLVTRVNGEPLLVTRLKRFIRETAGQLAGCILPKHSQDGLCLALGSQAKRDPAEVLYWRVDEYYFRRNPLQQVPQITMATRHPVRI